MPTVYIGIGSNLGSREQNCLKAIALLSENNITVTKQSSLYETEPWGVKDQPEFINMAAEASTDLEPLRLLKILKEIEKELGRQETERWGPRAIDLDILLYNDLAINTPELTIPHPSMHIRAFVLKPLSEIAPDKVHPVMGKTIKELLASIK